MKKAFLALGALSAVVIPIVTVISCGSRVVNGEFVWTDSTSTAAFTLTQEDTALKSIGLTRSGFKKISTDFDTATNWKKDNARKLTIGHIITLDITGSFIYNKDHGAIKPAITVDYLSEIKYKYNTVSNILPIKIYPAAGIKTNILDSMVLGLKYKNVSLLDAVVGKSMVPMVPGDLLKLFSNKISLTQNLTQLRLATKTIWGSKKWAKGNNTRSVTFPAITL